MIEKQYLLLMRIKRLILSLLLLGYCCLVSGGELLSAVPVGAAAGLRQGVGALERLRTSPAERPVFRLRSLSCSRELAANCFPLPLRRIERSLCKTMIYSRFSSFCTERATKKEPRKRLLCADKGAFTLNEPIVYQLFVSVFDLVSRIAYRLFA